MDSVPLTKRDDDDDDDVVRLQIALLKKSYAKPFYYVVIGVLDCTIEIIRER